MARSRSTRGACSKAIFTTIPCCGSTKCRWSKSTSFRAKPRQAESESLACHRSPRLLPTQSSPAPASAFENCRFDLTSCKVAEPAGALEKASECFEDLKHERKRYRFPSFVTSMNSVQTFYDTCQVPFFIFFMLPGASSVEQYWPGGSFHHKVYDLSTLQK